MKMKNTIKSTLLGILLIGLPVALSATTSVSNNHSIDYHIEAIEALPVPIERTIPEVHDALVGKTVRLTLTVTENGVPTDVQAGQPRFDKSELDAMEKDFVAEMADYVSHWIFKPAVDANGEATAAPVVMPVRIIEVKGKQVAQVVVLLDDRPDNLG